MSDLTHAECQVALQILQMETLDLINDTIESTVSCAECGEMTHTAEIEWHGDDPYCHGCICTDHRFD